MNRKSLRRQKSLAGKKNRGKRSADQDLQQLLQEAFNSHQAGRLEEAEVGYRKILQADPRHADANHFLGLIAHHFEHFEAAVERLEEIVETLEDGDASLEDAVGLYEEGVKLFRYCREQLDSAQKREEELAGEAGEVLSLGAFEDDDEEEEG